MSNIEPVQGMAVFQHECADGEGRSAYVTADESQNALLDAIVTRIRAATDRVWIKVPWWDTSPPAREVFDAVQRATRRGADVRVVMRNDASTLATLRALRAGGVSVRPRRYLHEKELITDNHVMTHSMNFTIAEMSRNTQSGVDVGPDRGATDIAAKFEVDWALDAAVAAAGEEQWARIGDVVPAGLAGYLKHDQVNPLQAKVLPVVLSTAGHALVVAPTGAGKTAIAEVAVLRAIRLESRKAAWLVPARALANEVGELKERWGRKGIRIEVLTGEDNLSSDRIARADLWLATTEKFESLARRGSLRDVMADIGCLVVDEVHLVGDKTRGATLESLLARLRLLHDQTRIVALSATATNADQLAQWLHADLLSSTWRPTQLYTQVIEYEPGEKRADDERILNDLVKGIATDLRGGDAPGNVLVFCRSKKVAEQTACHLAGVRWSTDTDGVAAACLEQGVGIHYRGAPQATQVLQKFLKRDIHTIVATSGLSTGVNTPARGVIVRDLKLGVEPLQVSTAQQMFGRAGRAGQDEAEGFAFLLAPRTEAQPWRAKLPAGYAVTSQIIDSLADSLLAEVLLGNISRPSDVDKWYAQTFAYEQGSHDFTPVQRACDLLLEGHLVTIGQDDELSVTALGRLTSRLMVDVASATRMLAALNQLRVPENATSAEELLLNLVAEQVTAFMQRPINEHSWDEPITRMLSEYSYYEEPVLISSRVSYVAALLALNAPEQLRRRNHGELRMSDLRDAVEEMPRYLAWVAALGANGHATWASVVAGDLARRITYWRTTPQPRRGSGRLLCFLERLCAPENRQAFVDNLWPATSARFTSPDEIGAPPRSNDYVDGAFERVAGERTSLAIEQSSLERQGINVTISQKGSPTAATIISHAGRSLSRTDVKSQIGAEFVTPIPDGVWANRAMSVEILAFTQNGDFAYDSVTVPVGPAALDDHADPVSRARELARALPDRVGVHQRSKVKSLFNKRAQTMSILDRYFTKDPDLRPIADALSGSATEPLELLQALAKGYEQLLPQGAGFDELRHPVSVLKSASASPRERAVTLAALAVAAGFDAGVAESRDTGRWFPVVILERVGYILSDAGQARTLAPLVPRSLPREVQSLPAPVDSSPVPVNPRFAWLTEYTSAE